MNENLPSGDSESVEPDGSIVAQSPTEFTAEQKMKRIDQMCTHVWMVRTFLKHCEEAEEDEELCEVHRDLYDFMLALGPAIEENDSTKYLKQAKKKLKRLKRAQELFEEIQPEISEHMNFKMANHSLKLACAEIIEIMQG